MRYGPVMALDASRPEVEPLDAVATKADIAALEARLQRSVIGLAITIVAVGITIGGTAGGFIVAGQGQNREDLRAYQQTAAEERRAIQEAAAEDRRRFQEAAAEDRRRFQELAAEDRRIIQAAIVRLTDRVTRNEERIEGCSPDPLSHPP